MVTSLPRRVELPLDRCNALFVALVEGPLLDPLRPQQPRVHEDAQVLARRRPTHAELVGDEYPAYAVAHEVAVRLRRKVIARLLEPREDLQPALVGERLDHRYG